MISDETLQTARRTAEELRERGEYEQAQAIEALVQATQEDALPTLDLLSTTDAGNVLGVSGQTIKNWVRQGNLRGYRIGGRIMVPRDALAEYIRRARQSVDLDVTSDQDAAKLVEEGRWSH